MTTLDTYITDLTALRNNPSRAAIYMQELLERVSDGQITLVNASNPTVMVLEAHLMLAASAEMRFEQICAKMNPSLATSAQMLYDHISDTDWIGAFALPASTKMTVQFIKKELIQAMVFNSQTGLWMLEMPRNTKFSVGGMVFSMAYPLQLRKHENGAIQAIFNTEKLSPVVDLVTNVADVEDIVDIQGNEYVRVSFPVDQFNVSVAYGDISPSAGLKVEATFEDDFYLARVWYRKNEKWVEINTTHSREVYAASQPTAILKVLDKRLVVTIPPVYAVNNQVTGRVMVAVYTTKAAIQVDLASYKVEDFGVNWWAIDDADYSVYSAPLSSLRDQLVYSREFVSGGRAALSFEDLRQRVVDRNLGNGRVPVTSNQLDSTVKDMGYTLTKTVDTTMELIYLASRRMPQPINQKLITPASAGVVTLQASLAQLQDMYGCYISTYGAALTSKSIYQIVNGIVKPLTVSQMLDLQTVRSRSPADFCTLVSSGDYVYSPMDYILDVSTDIFDVRAYHLDSPEVKKKKFIHENTSVLLQASVAPQTQIVRTNGGYQLTLATQNNASFKDLDDDAVCVFFSFVGDQESQRAFVAANMIGKKSDGSRVYQLDLQTDWFIDRNNTMLLTNALIPGRQTPVRAQLQQSFDVAIGVKTQSASGALDELIPAQMYAQGFRVIAQEQLTLSFGTALPNLWNRALTIAGELNYARWDSDQLLHYANDVYKVFDSGSTYKLVDGELVRHKLHSRGDVVYESDGVTPVYVHRQGDVKLDANGRPIDLGQQWPQRQFDLFVIDALYQFANDEIVKEYMEQINSSVIGWVTNDIDKMSAMLLNKSHVYFYPTQTKGMVEVATTNAQTQFINSEQAFTLKITLREDVQSDASLVEQMKAGCIRILSEGLKAPVVSLMQIGNTMKQAYSDLAYDFKLSGLGAGLQLDILRIVQTHDSLSVKKRLSQLPDGRFFVEEDVTVSLQRLGA